MKKTSLYQLARVATVMVCISSGMLQASESDDRVESSFKKTYVYATYLKDDDVTVKVEDGVVLLTGTVSEESHKTLAQETAVSLSGVTRVDNQLVTVAEAEAENKDVWIARKLKLALLLRRNVDAGKTDIEVTDGVVVLKGEADSLAQKELTAEYASDVEGVTSVKNEMTVAAVSAPQERTKREIIDDASITAQVKTALLTHRSTSSVKTMVLTRDGEVTLTGIAQNDAEKALVTKLVGDIQGVSNVKNKMTVAEVVTQ